MRVVELMQSFQLNNMSVCRKIHIHPHAPMQAQSNVENPPGSLSTCLFEVESFTTPDLTNSRLHCQLTGGQSPVSTLWGWNNRCAAIHTWSLCGSEGLSYGPLAYVASTSNIETTPQTPVKFKEHLSLHHQCDSMRTVSGQHASGGKAQDWASGESGIRHSW